MPEEIPLVDNNDAPEVYADGVAEVEINEPNVRIRLFKYRKLHGRLVRVVCLELIQPLTGCGTVAAMVARELTGQSLLI